jgi:hypothetical protein
MSRVESSTRHAPATQAGLGLPQSTALIVSSIIGVGIFSLPDGRWRNGIRGTGLPDPAPAHEPAATRTHEPLTGFPPCPSTSTPRSAGCAR